MNKFIYFFISLGFIISCSSGVGGDDSIEPNNSIEDVLKNKQWWFVSPDSTYGLFFGNNDSLYYIDETCNMIYDGNYQINNSDSTLEISNLLNGSIEVIFIWEIYSLSNNELHITLENNGSSIINQVFSTTIPDVCSGELSSFLTSTTFYNTNQEIENVYTNNSCHKFKLVFYEDKTGFVGGICSDDTVRNFNWNINGKFLLINGVFPHGDEWSEQNFDKVIEILDYNEESIEFSRNIKGCQIWDNTPFNNPSRNYLGYNFNKVFSEYYYENEDWDSDGNYFTYIDTSVTYYDDDNIYRFCDLNPSVILNTTGGNGYGLDLDCISGFETYSYSINFNGSNLVIIDSYPYGDRSWYQRKTYYSVID